MAKDKHPQQALLGEIDRYLAAVATVEDRVCRALAGTQDVTLRLVIKVDRGKIASLRLESNEGLGEPAEPENSP